MSSRTRAWYWLALAVVSLAVETAVYVLWPNWFPLIRGAHWIPGMAFAYNLGRDRGEQTVRQDPDEIEGGDLG